jgi:hypothetical protein
MQLVPSPGLSIDAYTAFDMPKALTVEAASPPRYA